MNAEQWITKPDTEDVSITVGGLTAHLWLKKELSYGEQRRVDTAGFKAVSGLQGRDGAEADPEINVDWPGQSIARTLAYVADWDLADAKGNKHKIERSFLEALAKPVMAAIETAISEHIARQEALRKNDPAGATSSSAISG